MARQRAADQPGACGHICIPSKTSPHTILMSRFCGPFRLPRNKPSISKRFFPLSNSQPRKGIRSTCGRGRRIQHCGEHKLVCGDNRKISPSAGGRAGTPEGGRPAGGGRQAGGAIMQNAKSVFAQRMWTKEVKERTESPAKS